MRIDRNRKMGSFGAKPQNGLPSACSRWECVGLLALWNQCPRRTRHSGKRELSSTHSKGNSAANREHVVRKRSRMPSKFEIGFVAHVTSSVGREDGLS